MTSRVNGRGENKSWCQLANSYVLSVSCVAATCVGEWDRLAREEAERSWESNSSPGGGNEWQLCYATCVFNPRAQRKEPFGLPPNNHVPAAWTVSHSARGPCSEPYGVCRVNRTPSSLQDNLHSNVRKHTEHLTQSSSLSVSASAERETLFTELDRDCALAAQKPRHGQVQNRPLRTQT